MKLVTLAQLHYQPSVTTGCAQAVLRHPVMLSANWPSTSQESWQILLVSMWGMYVQIRHLWTPAGAATWPFTFLHGFFSTVKISSRISVLNRHVSVNDFFSILYPYYISLEKKTHICSVPYASSNAHHCSMYLTQDPSAHVVHLCNLLFQSLHIL